ncbi:plasmalemma vesicle associated protein a isoform X2 [Xyrichtys novacula]|uniref:Plasmalemma vesicle associated protein a isoform X2 n=1 Tax=Xyrichtys novacula TaxID=13765 RepID=A0AAV1GI38_XYRNO|nr:plasmalemma vesicle associated protein a isoform X2 [Xyrichtys novacula]
MYSSKYSQVSKYSPEARKRMQHRSRGKSCGYYMRIVFFFSSLIQSLIIVSLVLFLIYGKKQDSPSTSRIHDLEESFSQLSIENVALRQQRKNLTTFLNTTLTEKARNDWDLARLRDYTNISVVLIQDMDKRMFQCAGELMMCRSQSRVGPCQPQPFPTTCNCGMFMEQLRARLELVESNFTQTVHKMRMDMDQLTKERDNLNLEAIRLRRDKSTHEKEVDIFKKKCKTDFIESLSGISNTTKAFLEKIDSLFPVHIAFQLTCPRQREHLEQIRTNCSSLSREVEDRFQQYLNSVGDKVTNIQSESSRLRAENWRLSEDYRWCSQNRTGLIQWHKRSQEQLQLKHDQDKEKLLVDKMKLHGEIEVLKSNVKYKTTQVEHLVEQVKHLNMTCMSRGGMGGFGGLGVGHQPRQGQGFGTGLLNGGGSSSSSSSSYSQLNRQGSGSSLNTGSIGSPYNRQTPTGQGSSNPSLLSNSGYGSNRQASSGSGSLGSSLLPSGSSGSSSSSGYGSNKPASSGSGSSLFSAGSSNSGYGSNKPASTGSGSSLFSGGSSNSGYGSNKPASTGSGSSLLSAGSNKPASTGSGSSLFSGGSSNSGYGSNKPASTGSGSSLFSAGSSNSGYGSNKPASTGSGSSSSSLFSSGSSSSGSSSNKPTSSGSGSSSSSLFSSGSSSSSGSNKPASTGGSTSLFGSSASSSSSGRGSSASASTAGGKSSSGTASSSSGSSGSTGSTGSTSKSSGMGWFNSWGSSSSSGQSKTGTGTGTGTGKGTSTGGGSSVGSGRTSGLVDVAQHLRDLQRIINPQAQEEKQDLSRMLG